MRIAQLAITTTLLTLWAALAVADVSRPEIPKAKEVANPDTKCVRPIDDMRKNHMNFILHQRDDTVRLGIRSEKHKGTSLKECIDCHNAPGKDGKVARVSEAEHFCNACHNYAAVKVDCFDCHADKPANAEYRNPVGNTKLPQSGSFDSKQLLNQQELDSIAAKGEKKP
jgi:hypothetical protein